MDAGICHSYRIYQFGVSSVIETPKVISKCGQKYLGQSISIETRQMATVCTIINAVENSTPNFFISPRKTYKEHLFQVLHHQVKVYHVNGSMG